jgi:hypothetical protein
MLNILRQKKLAGLRQIYTGLSYTFMRESVGLGLYYGGFHMAMRNIFKETERS